MRNSDALGLIALLQAFYPGAGRELPDETVELWGQKLERYELGDASEAIHEIASHGAFLPSISEIEAAIIECRNARLLRENAARGVLPAAASSHTEPAMSMTEYLAEETWHGDEHGLEQHLRTTWRSFPTLVRSIFEGADASDLSLTQARKRLGKHDYHSRDRISAACVVVADALGKIGLNRPEGASATAAFD